ncbi:hypothetical protein JW877_07185 [bacterium]|nr:hypothetical protein [bacterium]
MILLLLATLGLNLQAQGIFISSPRDGEIVAGNRIAVIIRGEPRRPLMVFVNGEYARSDSTRIDGVCDMLNLEVPFGPVNIHIEGINSQGKTVTDIANIHIIGPVKTLELLTDKKEYVADGKIVGDVLINLYDQWGIPCTYRYFLNMYIDGASFITPDSDSGRVGYQLQTQAGSAKAQFRIGNEAGMMKMSAEVNNITESVEIPLRTYMRDLILVGYLGGELGYHDAGGSGLDSLNLDDDLYEDGLYGDGRGAFFMKGAIFNQFLLTASYDSKVGRRRKVFRYFDPEKLYPVYGDNSSIFYEAQASTPLFLKIEKDQSFLMWGDYITDFKEREFTFYNRTFTGINGKLDTKYFNAKTFFSSTDRRSYMEAIRGEGVSGYYYLANTPVCEGTEKIRIETHDKYHPEIILYTETKSWPEDYEIDYQTGSILFKNPVHSQDGSDNPVYIIATYETPAEGLEAYSVGLRGELNWNDLVSLGGTFIREEEDTRPYSISGIDVCVTPSKKFDLLMEASISDQESSGTAYKVETNIKPFDFWKNSLYWRKVDSKFLNPFSSSVIPGEQKVGGLSNLTYKGFEAKGEFWNRDYSITDLQERGFKGDVSQSIKFVKIGFGIEGRTIENDTTINSLLATGFMELKPRSYLTFSLRHEENIGEDRVKPTSTTLGADFRVSENYTLFGRLMNADYNDDNSCRLGTIGVRTNILGVKAHGEYTLVGGTGEERGQALLGLNNRIQIIPHVFLDLSYERTQTLKGSNDNDFTAYSTALEITPNYGKFMTKGEFKRHNSNGDQLLMVLGGGISIQHSISLLFKDQFYLTKGKKSSYQDFRYASNKMSLGVAFRPVYPDYFNLIAKAEHKMNLDRNQEPWIYDHVALASIQGVLAVMRPLEITARYATKMNWQFIYHKHTKALTDLLMGRMRLELGKRVDIALEGRIMNQYEANDQKYGLSPELGIVFVKNTRFAIGYNIIGYQDLDFAEGNYWSRGPYISFKMKFNENVLGTPGEF